MRFFMVASMLVSALVLGAMAPPAHSADGKKDPRPQPESVMRVNGEAVTREQFNATFNTLLPRMTMHTSVSERTTRNIKVKTINLLIDESLTHHDAKEAKENKVSSKEMDASMEALKKRLPKGQTLKETLKKNDVTMESLKELMRRDIVIKRFNAKKETDFRKKAAEIVTDQYLLGYYNANLDKFREPDQLRIKVILVKADPSGGSVVWERALKKAGEAYKKIKGGEDFVKVSREYSQHPKADTGGDLGWRHKDSFDEINDAVNALKTGGVSAPVRTLHGYVVVKLEGVRPAVQRKFEELNSNKLRQELVEKEYNGMKAAWRKSLRDSAKIEYLSKDMQELSKDIK